MIIAFLLGTISIAGSAEIKVLSPNGHEVWSKGSRSPYVIRWMSTGVTGNVVIGLRKGDTPLRNLTGASGTPNTGTWLWTIPGDIPAGYDYTIRVKAADRSVKDDSNIPFTITDDNRRDITSEINVTSPEGGEEWSKGSAYRVSWSTGVPGKKQVVLWKGPGPLRMLTPPTGVPHDMIAWTVPDDLEPGDDYAIEIRTTNGSASGISRGKFSVTEPGFYSVPAAPPDLAIVGVTRPEYIGGERQANGPLHMGDTFPVSVRINNTSDIPADVFVATIGENPGFVERLSEKFLRPHSSDLVTVNLTVRRSNVRGSRFTTHVYLVDPNAAGTGVFQVLWKDSNKNDNTFEVSYEVAP